MFPVISLFLMVLCWWLGLTIFGTWIITHWGVTPTFPYYQILLDQLQAPLAIWGHFDGVQYLKIITSGYSDWGVQAYFPLFPLLLRGITWLLPFSPLMIGYAFNLGCLTLSLLGLARLFPVKHNYLIFLTLLFPTSFFLGALYTESLFLCLSIWFFVCLKSRFWFWAALLAAFCSATRLAGSFLAISLFVELITTPNLSLRKRLFYPILALSGILGYMFFLFLRYHDPFLFFHIQPLFAAGRSGDSLILLPQLLYRYLRMLQTVPWSDLLGQRVIFELSAFFVGIGFWFRRFQKLPLSMNLYLFCSLLLPTFSGTLSSYPRYLLPLVPFLFPARSFSLRQLPLLLGGVLLELYLFALFARGLFVS